MEWHDIRFRELPGVRSHLRWCCSGCEAWWWSFGGRGFRLPLWMGRPVDGDWTSRVMLLWSEARGMKRSTEYVLVAPVLLLVPRSSVAARRWRSEVSPRDWEFMHILHYLCIYAWILKYHKEVILEMLIVNRIWIAIIKVQNWPFASLSHTSRCKERPIAKTETK